VLKAASLLLPPLAGDTPPYFIVSEECYASDPEPVRNCNGIGHYEIIEWEANESLQLQANPQWPGEDKARASTMSRFASTTIRPTGCATPSSLAPSTLPGAS
jgi:hypothetical protein